MTHEYDDPADEEFPDHNHAGDEFLVVLRGSIAIKMGANDYLLHAGDEFYFPAKIIHSAKVGPAGCQYIVGEKT